MVEELTSVPLVSPSIGCEYNPAWCIICQKNKKGVKVSSTANGRSKVIDTANIRKDNLLNKLSNSKCLFFVYHVTNDCYKGYTLSKTLEQIQVGNDFEDINIEVDHTESMPPSKMKRWELSDFLKIFAYIYKRKKEIWSHRH